MPLQQGPWMKAGAEFACGEGVQGAKAGGKLDLGEAAVTVKPAKKICSGEIAFLDITFLTAGNEVAAGVVSQLRQRYDVIDAASCGSKAAQAIKTAAAFPGMNGSPERRRFQEVEIVEIEAARTDSGAAGKPAWASGADLIGEAHVDHMTGFAAFDEAQDTVGDEAAHSPASGVVGEARTASEPEDRELEPKLSFEAAVAKEVRIDDAVGGGQAQTRDKEVLELFPHLCGVGFFGWHGSVLKKNWFLAVWLVHRRQHLPPRHGGHRDQVVSEIDFLGTL